MSIVIRSESARDEAAIHKLTARAFEGELHSDGSEPQIVDRLRAAGDLTISLVAKEGDALIGHAAFSPVRISNGSTDWYGLGPISVEPKRQGEGIGSKLVYKGLDQLREMGAGEIGRAHV